jgi:pseudouridine-5'-phosphate glycosidase
MQGVKGKNITPFLLKYLADKTGGESLEANIQLVMNNASLGASIAVLFNQIFRS